jgi:CHAT domain-containing protein
MAATLGNIGAGFYRAALFDSADIYLARARDVAERIGDRRTAANAVGTLGSVAKDRGDRHRAAELYTAALALRARIGDARGIAADQNNLGLLSAATGDVPEARRRYEQALATARSHDLDEPAAAALLNLGNAASARAEYAEATRRYGEALAIYRALGYDTDVALVLHNIGSLALRRGDYPVATARFRDALTIYTRLNSVADAVTCRRDLASVALAAGDLRGALSQLKNAERLVSGSRSQAEVAAGIAMARADIALQLNSFAEAERQYLRAEGLYRQARNAAGQAEARQGRAMLLLERGQNSRALALLVDVARSQAAQGDRRPSALTQLAIGYALHRSGNLANARLTLARAADTLARLTDVVGEAAAIAAQGEVELDAGNALAAESLFRRGLSRLSTRPTPTVEWQLRAGLGRALQARGQFSAAAVELRAAVESLEGLVSTLASEDRRGMFLADKWGVYAQLAIAELATRDAAAAFATSERMHARQMLDVVARGRIAAPVRDSSLLEREQDLRRQIGELSKRLEAEDTGVSTRRGPGPLTAEDGLPGADSDALARAQEEYAQLLLELRDEQSARLPIARASTMTWREIAGHLSQSEALVEYLVSDSTTLAFVVTRDTLRAVNLAVSHRALESLVDFTRGAIIKPTAAHGGSHPAAWRVPLYRLDQQLVAPLERAGALAGIAHLVIVPHAELHYLPFAALIGGSGTVRPGRGTFLIERYDISYAPSASVWVRLGRADLPEKPVAETRVLALAPRTVALPGSRDEVEAIRSLYGSGATVLMGPAASEVAFLQSAPRYDVVHLATFGVLNKHNPLFSYVALNGGARADGRLEVHEVYGLELHARLLILSACQTALGSGASSDVPSGDDWVGLVRAFLGAGAQNVIATLWPVEDRSTAAVMARLHRGLRAGLPEESALAAAQREALRRPETADPFYWAGLVLVGSR